MFVHSGVGAYLLGGILGGHDWDGVGIEVHDCDNENLPGDAPARVSPQTTTRLDDVEQTRGQRQTGRNDLPGRVRELLNGW